MPVILRPAKLTSSNTTFDVNETEPLTVKFSSLVSPATYNSASLTPPIPENTLGSPIPSLSTFISKISAESLIKPNFFHFPLVLSYT